MCSWEEIQTALSWEPAPATSSPPPAPPLNLTMGLGQETSPVWTSFPVLPTMMTGTERVPQKDCCHWFVILPIFTGHSLYARHWSILPFSSMWLFILKGLFPHTLSERVASTSLHGSWLPNERNRICKASYILGLEVAFYWSNNIRRPNSRQQKTDSTSWWVKGQSQTAKEYLGGQGLRRPSWETISHKHTVLFYRTYFKVILFLRF